jgi:hypothetical protein
MNGSFLIPTPESIPAPAWLFIVLENALFLLHILLINIVLGTSMIALSARLFGKVQLQPSVSGLLGLKLPVVLPFAINLGIAPLLFMQVVYGHLFYTSSILMASYWLAVIPLLIVAYYGIYIYARRQDRTSPLNAIALAVATIIFLYIGFMLVNNVSLMSEPGRWTDYFKNRGGTMLNLKDPSLFPRYLHFLVASVAVTGLLAAVIASRQVARGDQSYTGVMQTGLKVFGWATVLQFGIGFWFLMALPTAVIQGFMGKNVAASVTLLLGVLAAVGAIVSAFRGKIRPAAVQLLVALVMMIIVRHLLREMFLSPYFTPSSLVVSPQYSILGLFLAVLVVGLATVGYMIRLSFASVKGGAQ